MWIQIRKAGRRIPWHRLQIDIAGQTKSAYLLRSIDKQKNSSRDTIVFTTTDQIVALLPEDIRIDWDVFSSQVAHHRKLWRFHAVPALKRIVSRYRSGKMLSHHPILTLVHHFGAVPALQIGEIDGFRVALFNENLGIDSELPPQSDEEHCELLFSLDEFLPHLFLGYYEQVAYYLRAIFFAADARQVITFSHGVREILATSIRSKLEAIENCPERYKSASLLAKRLQEKFQKELLLAHAVDNFAHLCVNYILSYYGVKHRALDYYSRLSVINTQDDIFGEDLIAYLKRLAEIIVNPPPESTVPAFLARREPLREEWVQIFFETSALLSEANRATRGWRLDAPMLFLSYHFGVRDGERFSEFLDGLLASKGCPLRVIRGRQISQDIRWSLLSRIWICDYHLLFLPTSWNITDSESTLLKELKDKYNWLNLELFYSQALNLELGCLTVVPFNHKLIEEFGEHIAKYSEERELSQIPKEEWSEFLKTAKSRLKREFREQQFLVLDSSQPDDFWNAFNRRICGEACRKLLISMFRAWSYSFRSRAWSLVQMLWKESLEDRRFTVDQMCDICRKSVDDPRLRWAKGLLGNKLKSAVRQHLDELAIFEFEFSEGAFAPILKRRRPIVTFELRAFTLYNFLTKKWQIESSREEFNQIVNELLDRA